MRSVRVVLLLCVLLIPCYLTMTLATFARGVPCGSTHTGASSRGPPPAFLLWRVRLPQAIDAAGAALMTLLIEQLTPALVSLAFRVGELRGMARTGAEHLGGTAPPAGAAPGGLAAAAYRVTPAATLDPPLSFAVPHPGANRFVALGLDDAPLQQLQVCVGFCRVHRTCINVNRICRCYRALMFPSSLPACTFLFSLLL